MRIRSTQHLRFQKPGINFGPARPGQKESRIDLKEAFFSLPANIATDVPDWVRDTQTFALAEKDGCIEEIMVRPAVQVKEEVRLDKLVGVTPEGDTSRFTEALNPPVPDPHLGLTPVSHADDVRADLQSGYESREGNTSRFADTEKKAATEAEKVGFTSSDVSSEGANTSLKDAFSAADKKASKKAATKE